MSRKRSLFDIFTEEAQEIVVSLERDLLDLENNMGDKQLIIWKMFFQGSDLKKLRSQQGLLRCFLRLQTC